MDSDKLLKPVKRLITALQKRYKHILHVIDEALQSENIKDKIWAVEQIIKRSQLDKAIDSALESAMASAQDKAFANRQKTDAETKVNSKQNTAQQSLLTSDVEKIKDMSLEELQYNIDLLMQGNDL